MAHRNEIAIKPIHQKKKTEETTVKGLGLQFEIERTKKELDRTDKILKKGNYISNGTKVGS